MAHYFFAVIVAEVSGAELKIALDPVLPEVQQAFRAAALAQWESGTWRVHSSVVVRGILYLVVQTKRTGVAEHQLARCREFLSRALHRHVKARALQRSALLADEKPKAADADGFFRVCAPEPDTLPMLIGEIDRLHCEIAQLQREQRILLQANSHKGTPQCKRRYPPLVG